MDQDCGIENIKEEMDVVNIVGIELIGFISVLNVSI